MSTGSRGSAIEPISQQKPLTITEAQELELPTTFKGPTLTPALLGYFYHQCIR